MRLLWQTEYPMSQAPSWAIGDPVWHHKWRRCDFCEVYIDRGMLALGGGVSCSVSHMVRMTGSTPEPEPESRWGL